METLFDAYIAKTSIKLGETQDLVALYTASSDITVKGRLMLYFSESIDTDVISANNLLAAAISGCQSGEDLPLVALAIRKGANKNMYLNTPGVGICHLMVYTLSILRAQNSDINLIKTVLMLLYVLGSSSSSPAFSQEPKSTGSEGEVDSKFLSNVTSFLNPENPIVEVTKDTSTVREWMISQGYPGYLDAASALVGLSDDIRMTLGAVCDIPEMAYIKKGEQLQTPAFESILLSRAVGVGKLLPIFSNSRFAKKSNGEVYGISKCIDIGFFEMFCRFIDSDFSIEYTGVNRIIVLMRDAYASKNRIYLSQLKKMLIYAVENGESVDTSQLSMLSLIDDRLAKEIIEAYSKPYWKKICLHSNEKASIPEALKHFAFSLNVDSNGDKASICSDIAKLSRADPEQLKRAVIIRQRARAAINSSSMEDFISGSPAPLSCTNKTPQQTDPLTYNDAQLSFYTDKLGLLWCFTSDLYENLNAKKINPYNGEALPIAFQQQISKQVEILKLLGIGLDNPQSVVSAIDAIKSIDLISDTASKRIVETLTRAAIAAGISEEKFTGLTLDQKSSTLLSIGVEVPYLVDLTPTHQLTTFCRIAHSEIKGNPSLSVPFFGSVQKEINGGVENHGHWIDGN